MYNHDIKMLREKIKETNVSSSSKWQVSNKMNLVHIISLSYRATLWQKEHNKVKNASTNKEVYQFQVSYVLYLKLKQNKAFIEKIYKCLYHKFDEKTPASMRKTLKYGSNRAIAQTMFYENRKSIILKVLGVVMY